MAKPTTVTPQDVEVQTFPTTPPEDIPNTTETSAEPTSERDEFASPEYLDPNARLPKIQALRGTTPKLCGYFVPAHQMAKAGWIDFDSSKLITYTFESSGEEEQGILISNPRMLVCPRTPCLAYDKEASKTANQPVIIGVYTSEHKDDDNIGNTQYFEVILLDDKNQPLHQVPLSYRASGANQATFSSEWQQFIDEMTACHAITNGIAARGKDARFKSLCVFVFKTAREQVGKKQKSFACRVVSHDKPTLENWRNYFVGFDRSMKHLVWENLQPTLPLMIPGVSSSPQLLGNKLSRI
ncbi:MAG TPA: hypothetical protein DCL61_13055 [Cyanobacteria bacterium UBA12227]|nr:hypothetical protein [Cyanobacteria bacterium UBA12227]HAX88321.1 hypothetical protein [Cyanobacteria bacterium UBA11370]HBY81130.1 hypothetical protein [Cyanobacteria bacterium UBA11148]